jgi:hypothetical protein
VFQSVAVGEVNGAEKGYNMLEAGKWVAMHGGLTCYADYINIEHYITFNNTMVYTDQYNITANIYS